MKDELAYDETFRCVQCGYCLPHCPTYETMKKETHSPRGRINLVKMAAEGKISLEALREPIDLCLGCRACETVCPTNVPYGDILESAKTALLKKRHAESKSAKAWDEFLFKKTIPNKKRLRLLERGLYFYQRSGMKKLAHATGVLKLFPEKLAAFEKVTPKLDKPSKKNERLRVLSPKGEPIYRVAFFTGCIMDTMFAKLNDLSMKLLQKSGCEVILIDEQTCCGALQSHHGDREYAKRLAKKNIEAFENVAADFIVNSIGGCGAMLVEYDKLFKEEEEWFERAKAFAAKSKDISYVLSKLELPFQKEINKVATYQPSCHMTNVQKNVAAPLQLIRSIPGLRFVEQEKADMCCGSAGIYNFVHYDEAMNILDVKMKHIKETNPDLIITTNPGCHLQMKLGVERGNLQNRVEVVHLVELLAEACNIE